MYPMTNQRKEKKEKEQEKHTTTNHNIIPFVGLKTLQASMFKGITEVKQQGQSSGQ
jgi:hypothetical protein